MPSPLLVLEFPLLLALGRSGRGLFRNLGIGSLLMLAFAWIAEESRLGSTAWWSFYAISCVAWLFIVYILYSQVSERRAQAPAAIARSGRMGAHGAHGVKSWHEPSKSRAKT